MEMGTTANVSIRLDNQLKLEAEGLFGDLGLNMTTALTMFLRQAVRTQGIPFEITRVPNAETVAAMKEAERVAHDPSAKGYTDLDEMFKDLRA
jgi:DNA-damage-inducible protein J